MDMTSKERMYAAYRGDPVDRVPIWLREGFALSHPPAEADHFNAGWQTDPLYRELIDYVKPHADDIVGWGIPGNRLLMIPGRYIRSQTVEDAPTHRIDEITIDTPSGDLKSVVRRPRHESHSWTLKYPVETVDDLRKLASVPWELDPPDVERARENYRQAHAAHGDRVMLRTFLSSPVVCISGSMPLELFLELSLTERAWFHELTDEITRRQLAILETVFDGQ